MLTLLLENFSEKVSETREWLTLLCCLCRAAGTTGHIPIPSVELVSKLRESQREISSLENLANIFKIFGDYKKLLDKILKILET